LEIFYLPIWLVFFLGLEIFFFCLAIFFGLHHRPINMDKKNHPKAIESCESKLGSRTEK